MSQFSLSLVSAEAVQGELMDHFSVFARSFTYLPETNFLTSSVNTNNVLETVVSPGNGKLRTAKTVFTPRYREADVSDTVTFSCTSSNEAGQTYTTCTIDPEDGVKVSEKIDLKDLANIEMDNERWIAQRIASMMEGASRRRETRISTKLAAAVGKFPENDTNVTGGNLKTVSTLITTASDSTSLDGIEEIEYTRRLALLDSMYLFGSNLLTKYVTRLDSGCCADNYGVDLGDFRGRNGFVYFHDNRIEDALGSDEFLMLAPGAAHLVRYNLFSGSNAYVDDSYRQMTIANPMFPGDVWDMTFKVDCGVLYIEIGQAFEVCTAPTTYFALDDRLDGVNGIFNGKVVNAAS